MAIKAILEAAQSLAVRGDLWALVENGKTLRAAKYLQSGGFAVEAGRPPTVPYGCARLRFSLTCGIADDELVRLEDCLNSWRDHACWSAVVARA
jgi:hypothetical protein